MADSRTFLAMANAKFKVRTAPAPSKLDRSEEHKSRHIRKRTVRCSDRCKRHLFSIMKIPTTGQHKSLRGAKYDTEHRFCQTYNEFVGLHEGGIPQFNLDCKIETPSFVAKSQKDNNYEPGSSVCRQRFKQHLAKATNSTLEESRPPIFGKGEQPFKQIKDQNLGQIIKQFMTILKRKDKAEGNKH